MADYVIINGELYHWGIKGMKWGVRRTPAQLGHKTNKKTSAKKINSDNKIFHDIETLSKCRNNNWSEKKIRDHASQICKEVITTRGPKDHHKFLSKLSTTLDATVYDNPSILAVNVKTGNMRYNDTTVIESNGAKINLRTGTFKSRDLDRVHNAQPGSYYYYMWGERQV